MYHRDKQGAKSRVSCIFREFWAPPRPLYCNHKGLTAGALGITGKIANYPGILEPISGADLLARMLVDGEFQTRLPGVFAVGDILCHHVKQAVVAAAEGAVAAMAVDKYLHGRRQMVTDWAK